MDGSQSGGHLRHTDVLLLRVCVHVAGHVPPAVRTARPPLYRGPASLIKGVHIDVQLPSSVRRSPEETEEPRLERGVSLGVLIQR